MQTVPRLVMLLAAIPLPVIIAGCPPPGNGGNTAPVVNAGPTQAVTPGAVVTLNGSGTDADGDALAFIWTQLGGTQVVLSGADTAAATFTAPSTPGTLVFQLTVSDSTASVADVVEIDVNAQASAALVPLPAAFLGNAATASDISNPGSVDVLPAPSALNSDDVVLPPVGSCPGHVALHDSQP